MDNYASTPPTFTTPPTPDSVAPTPPPPPPDRPEPRPADDPLVHALVNAHVDIALSVAAREHARGKRLRFRGLDLNVMESDALRLLWRAAQVWDAAITADFREFAGGFICAALRKRLGEPGRLTVQARGDYGVVVADPASDDFSDDADVLGLIRDLGMTADEADLLFRVLLRGSTVTAAVRAVFPHAGESRQAATERYRRALDKLCGQIKLAGLDAAIRDDLPASA